MTDIEKAVYEGVCRNGLSNREVAEQLNMTPSEVAKIAVRVRKKALRNAPSVDDENSQIRQLRQQVRAGLLMLTRPEAVERVPASALVRLWQLIEKKELLTEKGETEDNHLLQNLPDELRQEIFRLLDTANIL